MILNKANNGSAELKELIGFIYKSITFNNLNSYIEFAERDIRKIIGSTVFSLALNHYNSVNYLAEIPEPVEGEPAELHPEYAILDELVKKIQLPVAIHAYRRYVPSSDLTHSNKGRQIFVSENEKPAFEWQIEKDNENLLAMAAEATDVLLEFLDTYIDWAIPADEGEEENAPLIPWGTTPEYAITKELLLNTASEFDKVFPINTSRLTYMALVPFIKRVQDADIRSCFTAEKYAELKQEIIDGDISEANQLLIDKARQPLALLAMSIAVKRLSSQVLPDGVFSNVTVNVVKGRNQSSKSDRNEISTSLEKDGMKELVKLQEYLRKLDLVESGETYTADDPSERIDETLLFVRL